MWFPRFRFTLWQLITLIAFVAMFFGLLRTPAWPFGLAMLPVVPGFAIDRARGGPGILGSMVAGAIELAGFALPTLLEISGVSAFPGLLVVIVGTAFLAAVGLGWGLLIGSWLWLIALASGMGTGAEPLAAERIGSIAGRGIGDRKPPYPQAGGHPV